MPKRGSIALVQPLPPPDASYFERAKDELHRSFLREIEPLIRARREATGQTMKEVMDALGSSDSLWNFWRAGETFKLETISALIEKLGGEAEVVVRLKGHRAGTARLGLSEQAINIAALVETLETEEAKKDVFDVVNKIVAARKEAREAARGQKSSG